MRVQFNSISIYFFFFSTSPREISAKSKQFNIHPLSFYMTKTFRWEWIFLLSQFSLFFPSLNWEKKILGEIIRKCTSIWVAVNVFHYSAKIPSFSRLWFWVTSMKTLETFPWIPLAWLTPLVAKDNWKAISISLRLE